MHTDSFEVELLLRTPFDDMEPSWSPDGQFIAFVSGEASVTNDGSQDIYLVRADGSDLTNVTRSPANDRMPEWSPDGSRLVFLSMSPIRGLAQTGYWDIAIVNRDGTGFTRLTAVEQDHDKPVWRP
jgi:Tol biopolymer transport system component